MQGEASCDLTCLWRCQQQFHVLTGRTTCVIQCVQAEGAQPLQARANSGQPGSVPMSATRVVMHQIVLPGEVDAAGVCFGGQVLPRSWQAQEAPACCTPCISAASHRWAAGSCPVV